MNVLQKHQRGYRLQLWMDTQQSLDVVKDWGKFLKSLAPKTTIKYQTHNNKKTFCEF